jgi:hypothetical protein
MRFLSSNAVLLIANLRLWREFNPPDFWAARRGPGLVLWAFGLV